MPLFSLSVLPVLEEFSCLSMSRVVMLRIQNSLTR